MCLVCCVFDSICELFCETIPIFLGVILLLNVMVLFSVGGGALLDRPDVCCACDRNVHLDAPSICLFVFLYAGSYLII